MTWSKKLNKWVGYNREYEAQRLTELTAIPPEERLVRFADFIDTEANFQPSKIDLFFGQFWDTFKKPPKERNYVQKLDLCILIYSLLSFFVKTLDNSNVSNAYVSGMKEELHLYGQERNLFTTFFNVGSIVGAVPSQMILNRIRPSIWIPSCELSWSIMVMIISSTKGAKLIYAMRFLMGITESVAYPGFALVLGSWYRPDELAKRMTIYDGAWAIANMFSGYIQAGVYTSMNGLGGLAGWRWLFIIDGLIGLPIAILGYFAIPDFPINSRVMWMSQVQRDYSVIRMQEVGRRPPRKLTLSRMGQIMKSWRPYGFVWPYIFFNLCDTSSYWNLWLKSLNIYTVQQINLIPTAGYACGLVSGYLIANMSDRAGKRFPFLMLAVFFNFLGNLLLAIWDVPFGVKMFAFFLPEIGYPLWGLMLTWGAETFQDDAEMRGLAVAMGNTMSSAMGAWFPLVAFPTPQAPEYKLGYKLVTGLHGLEALGLVFFLVMSKRELKTRGKVLNKFGLAVDIEDYTDNGTDEMSLEMADEEAGKGVYRSKGEDVAVTVKDVTVTEKI
ncbi:major facilitator superfamily domain-containing protein [Lipomyces tetrasporus]